VVNQLFELSFLSQMFWLLLVAGGKEVKGQKLDFSNDFLVSCVFDNEWLKLFDI